MIIQKKLEIISKKNQLLLYFSTGSQHSKLQLTAKLKYYDNHGKIQTIQSTDGDMIEVLSNPFKIGHDDTQIFKMNFVKELRDHDLTFHFYGLVPNLNKYPTLSNALYTHVWITSQFYKDINLKLDPITKIQMYSDKYTAYKNSDSKQTSNCDKNKIGLLHFIYTHDINHDYYMNIPEKDGSKRAYFNYKDNLLALDSNSLGLATLTIRGAGCFNHLPFTYVLYTSGIDKYGNEFRTQNESRF